MVGAVSRPATDPMSEDECLELVRSISEAHAALGTPWFGLVLGPFPSGTLLVEVPRQIRTMT